MNASTAVELAAFLPAVGAGFEIFGDSTQGDLDFMKQELELNSLERMTLQSIWARHPRRRGEKNPYTNSILVLMSPYYSPNFQSVLPA